LKRRAAYLANLWPSLDWHTSIDSKPRYRKRGRTRHDCVTENQQRKTVRSYRLVFRRRWRIFRIQGWRTPLPGGIELRLLSCFFGNF
jgi:hypothetical protein